MILLTGTNQTIVVNLETDGDLDVSASWVDGTATATIGGSSQDTYSTLGDYDLIAAPAASTERIVKSIAICNQDPLPATVRVSKKVATSQYRLFDSTELRTGDALHYEDGHGWYIVRAVDGSAYSGRSVSFFKAGTGADTVGYWYCHSKDAGFPGAWAVGTPGLNGRATDGTASGDAGCLVIPNAATGGNCITGLELSSTVAQFYQLVDVLWVNSGLVVTTTTGQSITSPTLPARDANGSTNGEGCMIGLLFTAASTNAAVINNATVTYTNSAGTGSRTATLANLVGAQIPATPVIGTIVWFQLQAGDKGVRSIQSIALGTSLVTGSVSLLIARQLATYSSLVANVGAGLREPMNPGVRIHNGVCALLCYQASATTATTVAGSLTVQERAI